MSHHPTIGIPAPVLDCGCSLCYRGAWQHSVQPDDDPGFLRTVLFGAEPPRWTDTCPACVPPAGERIGMPVSWKLGRMAFQILAFWASVVLWSHILLAAGGR
jgi:hypothetical protein